MCKNDAIKLSYLVKDFKADAFLSIARGGLTLSHLMAQAPNQRELFTINSISYDRKNQKECENDFSKTLNTINVNFTGAVSILNIIANDMEKSKNGFIVGVSSVAGDRGRKANYIYGSSKAAFSAYLSGLRNRLFESKVQVLTVKPGFVAQQKGKDILYTKSIWKLIMLIIKHIPEWKFKRMSI